MRSAYLWDSPECLRCGYVSCHKLICIFCKYQEFPIRAQEHLKIIWPRSTPSTGIIPVLFSSARQQQGEPSCVVLSKSHACRPRTRFRRGSHLFVLAALCKITKWRILIYVVCIYCLFKASSICLSLSDLVPKNKMKITMWDFFFSCWQNVQI